MTQECRYIRLDSFLRAMCDGWRLPFVVEPMDGHHGHYAILMWRPA